MTTPVVERFEGGTLPRWARLATGHARLEHSRDTIRFVVGGARSTGLSDAQIDDYHGLSPRSYPWRPPVKLEVRARMSHPAEQLLGTAGFGFWNDPFAGQQGATTVAPNNVWFFFASPPSDMRLVSDVPGCGWKAAMLNGGNPPGWIVRLGAAALRLPGLGRMAQRAERTQVRAAECALEGVSLTEWQVYRLHWLAKEARFWVGDREVLRVENPPTVPLGFVVWMDNQWARFTPAGEFAFGLLDVPQEQWLEVDYVRIESGPAGRENEEE
ncbi:MAG: hypothetical protein GXP41_08600 [Chloroflexi bacterium]|nr:hypothetical protein [Chloroflexota bacterium]